MNALRHSPASAVLALCAVLATGSLAIAVAGDQEDRPAARFSAAVRAWMPGDLEAVAGAEQESSAEPSSMLGTWTVEPVEPGGGYIDQAYDPAGHPSLAYTSYNLLRYAEHNGSQWLAETVTQASTITGISLAQGPGGPAISFMASGKGSGIKLATKGASGWTVEVLAAGSHGEFTSVAFGPSGNPAVVYLDPNKKLWNLVYAEKIAGVWSKQVIDTGGFRYVAVAFDPLSGNPAIAYAAASSGSSLNTLKFASRNGGTWQKPEIVLTGTAGYGVFCDLAFDPVTGAPAIVHAGPGDSGGLFTTRSGSGWSTQSFDSCTDYCGREPRLAYYKISETSAVVWIASNHWGATSAQDEVRAASYDGTTWVREHVETASPYFVSVGVESNGQPTIGYDGVVFARRTP